MFVSARKRTRVHAHSVHMYACVGSCKRTVVSLTSGLELILGDHRNSSSYASLHMQLICTAHLAIPLILRGTASSTNLWHSLERKLAVTAECSFLARNFPRYFRILSYFRSAKC